MLWTIDFNAKKIRLDFFSSKGAIKQSTKDNASCVVVSTVNIITDIIKR